MHRFFKLLLPIFLALPIVIFQIFETEIPLSDLVLAAGFGYLLISLNTKAALYFIVVVIFALLSVIWTQLEIGNNYGFRPYLSVIFFLKPLLGYFAARGIVKTNADHIVVIRALSLGMSVAIVSIFADVMVNFSGISRDDSFINGSVLGITQYATYGVNSAASYYFVMFAVILYSLTKLPNNRFFQYFYILALSCCAYLILGSLSREVILGFAFFIYLFYLTCVASVKRRLLLFFAISSVIFSYFFAGQILESEFLNAKINQVIDGWAIGDLNHITSGRIELYEVALNQILQSPVVGTGFHGYQLLPELISFDMDPVGLSPHNQYLTTIWKGGLVFLIAYYLNLLFLLKKSKVLLPKIRQFDSLSIYVVCVLLILANVWDVLMVANFGAAFFFILGVLEARENKGVLESRKTVLRQLNA